jgi:hypothetical protein
MHNNFEIEKTSVWGGRGCGVDALFSGYIQNENEKKLTNFYFYFFLFRSPHTHPTHTPHSV